VINETLAHFAYLWSNLGQPDDRFYRFDLTEERTYTAEGVMTPVLKEPSGFGGDTPGTGVWQFTPLVHLLPDGIDDGSVVVPLFLGGKPEPLIENQRVLLGAALLLTRLGYWGDELGSAARMSNLLGWLTRSIKFPVMGWHLIRGVENWFFEKKV
jgi:hypothetical protein